MNPPKFGSLFLRAAYTDSDRAPKGPRTERKVPPMKIVILRTPPIIAPILRRMLGIRKEKKR